MKIRGSLPLFIRINAKLARFGAELEGSGRHLEKLRGLQSDEDMRELTSSPP